jgi:hypothetical protein
MLENYYRTIGIPADADEAALKKAFRKLALKFHPDVNHAPDANERFQQLCEAYEVLLRHIKRQTTIHSDRREEAEEDGYSYEDVIREAREAAYKRARMKYEKMKAEKELFEQSSWREVFLFFNYAGRILAFPLVVVLFVFPVFIGIKEGPQPFIILLFLWIIGGVLLLQMINFRKTWFKQGKFKWKMRDFFKLFDFSPITENPTADCYYCKGKKADAKPLTRSFYKIREILLHNQGVYQHYVGYKRKFKDVVIPRSAKAGKVHFWQSFIKISSLILSLLFVPYPDIIWRFCFGLFAGLCLSGLLLLLTGTRSKVSYMLSYFVILKIFIWMIVIISQTTLYPGFILESTEITFAYLMILLFFGDLVLDLLLKLLPFYHQIYQPVFPQGPVIDRLYREGYQNYLDIPVWSTIYPLFTWFF